MESKQSKEAAMYVVTGASGHTGSVIARKLLKNGSKVRVIGRNPEHLKALAAEGAEPFSADLTDVGTLTKALLDAKAAYVLIPPNIGAPDVRAFQSRVADATAAALKNAGIAHVVVLSSIGADKAERTGPVAGLHYLEEQLNQIKGLNALYLRAGYFMENTLAQVGLIQKMGMTAGPLRPDLKLPMIATRDIGEAAANALLALNFHEKQARELLGQRNINMNEVTAIIGKAIGKPDLKYIQAPDDQIRPALMQIGMSPNMTDLLLEMSTALNSGYMRPLEQRSAENTTPTPYETFVNEEFVPLYKRGTVAA
jgi:uncharacterized protein YbjT (DUF2867 family)